ncbi:MAG TPA: DUF58 domain-containing protein [Clostridia bacterium]|nr:DUF58 domain-containing protein [Clostridia bacterium]
MSAWLKSVLSKVLSSVEYEAWVRFLVAIVGLALALAAAVLSTVASESGNVLATGILASAALLLAAVVGLTTVPYLARRVVVAGMRDAFDFDVTREGVAYIVLTLVIGVAALNTGNNLLFLVVAAMLAAVLVGGVSSALVLRGLLLEVNIPAHVFAGTAVSARLVLRNLRRLLPALSVSVVPPRQKKTGKRWGTRHTVFVFPSEKTGRKPWVRWPDIWFERKDQAAPGEAIFRERVYFPYIAPGDAGRADLELRFDRRGRYVQNSFGLATRFPFSFLVKTRRVPLNREIVVYPPVEPTDELFEVLPMITGEFESYVRGRGYDLYRIREYGPEDSARHVDWKSTAKSGSLKVREFTREDERKLRIVFDNPAPGVVSQAAYENAVALAASLGWHFADEHTELSFAAAGYDGGHDVYQFLAYLALVKECEGTSVLETLDVTDDYNVVLTARQRGSIPSRLWQSSYFVFIDK